VEKSTQAIYLQNADKLIHHQMKNSHETGGSFILNELIAKILLEILVNEK
jgi:hypothetical protein